MLHKGWVCGVPAPGRSVAGDELPAPWTAEAKGRAETLFRVEGEALLWSEPWARGAERMACWVPSETPSWGVRSPPEPGLGKAEPSLGWTPPPRDVQPHGAGPWVSIESHRLLVGLAFRFAAVSAGTFFSDQNAGERCALG